MKTNILTQRQENFCLNIVSGMSATAAAIKAGYTSRSATFHTTRWLKMDKIEARIAELRAPAVNSIVMPLEERKERLSEFVREDNLTDKGNLARASNIAAVKELNLMEKVYSQPIESGVVFKNNIFILPDGTRLLPRGEDAEG